MIERSASGLNVDSILDVFLNVAGSLNTSDLPLDDGGGGAGLLFRTQSFLQCGSVSGAEVIGFVRAPIEERRRQYISWKRREIEAQLAEGYQVCPRCKILFRAYDNAWNRAGLCSKACHSASLKSREKSR